MGPVQFPAFLKITVLLERRRLIYIAVASLVMGMPIAVLLRIIIGEISEGRADVVVGLLVGHVAVLWAYPVARWSARTSTIQDRFLRRENLFMVSSPDDIASAAKSMGANPDAMRSIRVAVQDRDDD